MKFLKSHKRITIFAGHYGSGKTNIAVNYAKELKKKGESVLVADLDIVNPYFRTKDSENELKEKGIELLCSPYAGSNLDIPALPQEMYRAVQDKNTYAVMDIGGDDAGVEFPLSGKCFIGVPTGENIAAIGEGGHSRLGDASALLDSLHFAILLAFHHKGYLEAAWRGVVFLVAAGHQAQGQQHNHHKRQGLQSFGQFHNLPPGF
jgi:hypothetical protein